MTGDGPEASRRPDDTLSFPRELRFPVVSIHQPTTGATGCLLRERYEFHLAPDWSNTVLDIDDAVCVSTGQSPNFPVPTAKRLAGSGDLRFCCVCY